MDGHFVDNISFGPAMVKTVRGLTSLPLDVHLMIEHPDHYAPRFIEAGANSITVHVEAGSETRCRENVARDSRCRLSRGSFFESRHAVRSCATALTEHRSSSRHDGSSRIRRTIFSRRDDGKSENARAPGKSLTSRRSTSKWTAESIPRPLRFRSKTAQMFSSPAPRFSARQITQRKFARCAVELNRSYSSPAR